MLGRQALVLVLILLSAGCVTTPGASIDPASLAALDAVSLEGATLEVLPNGDRMLTLVTEVAGVQELEFEVPHGTTFVEAVVEPVNEGDYVSVSMANAESRMRTCMSQTWYGWNQRTPGARCSAIAAGDPETKWIVLVSGGLFTGSPLDALPVSPPVDPFGGGVDPVGAKLTLTFSAQPLDGSAGAIKLDALSRATYALTETFSAKVPASLDGALLNVEVTLPEGEGPWPVVMQASPYSTPGRAAQGRASDATVQYWVARGYGFVTMDLRGTGTSGGCYAARSAKDPMDIADAVTWVSEQEWSNGKIGMTGFSYVGYTPAAAAAMGAPMTTMYIGGAAVDMYANYLPGGVDTGRTASGIVLGYGVGSAAVTTPDDNPLGPAQYTADAFCDPTILLGNDPRHVYDAWWAERNISALVADIKVPVALEQGFYDNNVKANYVPDFFNALDVPKRAIFGPWQHIWAYRADQQVRVLAWMDHWLKGVETGIMDTPVVEVHANTGEWRAADAWPTPGTTDVAFDLAGGSLVASPPSLPTAVGGIVVETEPLAEAVYLTGVAALDIAIAVPTGGAPQLEARLYEVLADGEEIFAAVGWHNAAHRPDHATFAPFAPGESDLVTLAFLPQDHVFQAGSTIRVELLSATGSWGGDEAGLQTPARADVDAMTLRLPSLPASTLTAAARSAS